MFLGDIEIDILIWLGILTEVIAFYHAACLGVTNVVEAVVRSALDFCLYKEKSNNQSKLNLPR